MLAADHAAEARDAPSPGAAPERPMQFRIAIGQNRYDKDWKNASFSWDQFAGVLKTRFKRAPINQAEYQALPKSKQAEYKDAGCYLTGSVDDSGRRNKEGVVDCCALHLDADSQRDSITPELIETALPGVAAIRHTTMSHTEESPRDRFLVPLKRPIRDKNEYAAVARKVAEKFGIERFDPASFKLNQVMFMPAATADGPYQFDVIKGEPLDPDAILAEYVDWTDKSSWPRASTDPLKPEAPPGKLKKHPRELSGVPGAFCRAFGDIATSIDTHLSDVYTDGTTDNRRTFIGGKNPDGLVLYAHGSDPNTYQFATSHHTGHDPAAGYASLNGFDLCRIHLFGHLDAESEDHDELHAWLKSIGCMPSREAAEAWARDLPEVAEELRAQEEEALRVHREALRVERATPAIQATPAAGSEQPGSIESHKPRLPMLTLADLAALPRSVQWHVKGVIPAAALVLLYGASNVGKSFIVADLLMSSARGVDWMGRRTKQGGVLYVAAEGAGGFRNRIEAYRKHHPTTAEDVPFFIVPRPINVCSRTGVVGEEMGADDVVEACASLRAAGHPVSVVALDTLNMVMGGGDENSSVDMGLAIAGARYIQRKTGASVILVHHPGKDASKGARGHSSLRAAVDTEIEVTAQTPGRPGSIWVHKQRDGANNFGFGFTLERVKLGVDDDLDDITSKVVVPALVSGAPVARPPAKGRGKWQTALLAVLTEVGAVDGLTREALVTQAVARAGGGTARSHEAAVRALDTLVGEGLVQQTGGLYLLPAPGGFND